MAFASTGWLGRGRLFALSAALALPWGCSLIATFDDRPSPSTGGSGGHGTGGGGSTPPPLVEAFPLSQCEAAPDASPVRTGPCDYRDESCSGFADFGHDYVEKVTAIADGVTLGCDPGALVAYEVPADAARGTQAELRVLARERKTSGPCPESGGEQITVLLRLDAQTLTLIEKVGIEIVGPSDAPVPPPDGLVFGRSERRVVAAYRADDPEGGASRVWVLSLPIDQAPAAATPVPSRWTFHLAAKLAAPETFVPSKTSAVDDLAPGKVYVSVEATDAVPVFTIGDEEIGEEVPFTSLLRFNNGTAQPARAELFARTTTRTDDAGTLVERVTPGAVSRTRSDPLMTVTSNQLVHEGLTNLRYLVVPGAGSPTGRAEPWYAASALMPERPGAAFDLQPLHLRLEIFGFEGRSYAQLRGCARGDDKACTLPAKSDGGVKDLDMTGVPSCGTPIELIGALEPDDPGTASNVPKAYATCDLGAGVAGSGRVTWHREAGGFGAALHPDGDTLWLVRPGGGTLVGGNAMIQLGAATAVGAGAPLAANGPLSIAFVDGLGWVVAAVEGGAGRLWTRRFGCASGR